MFLFVLFSNSVGRSPFFLSLGKFFTLLDLSELLSKRSFSAYAFKFLLDPGPANFQRPFRNCAMRFIIFTDGIRLSRLMTNSLQTALSLLFLILFLSVLVPEEIVDDLCLRFTHNLPQFLNPSALNPLYAMQFLQQQFLCLGSDAFNLV